MRSAFQRSSCLALALVLALGEGRAWAEPTASTEQAPPPVPKEKSEPSLFTPPAMMWPVYVLGAIGIGGLGTAAVFGGLKANASHAVDVSTQAILRNGGTLAVCDATPVEPPYGEVCAHRKKNQRLARSDQGVFVPSLVIGISATALALGWFLFAPKEQSERSARGPHVVPWMGVGSGGATVEGRF